jgi:hypothetical protein
MAKIDVGDDDGWQARTPYDESVCLNALKRRGSPLIGDMATTAQIS